MIVVPRTFVLFSLVCSLLVFLGPAKLMADDLQPQYVRAYIGNTITLQGVEGALAYQWYKEDASLGNNDRIAGVQTPALRITDALLEDSGVYTLKTVTSVLETNISNTIIFYTNSPSLDECTQTNFTRVDVLETNASNTFTTIFITNSLPSPTCEVTNLVIFIQTNRVFYTTLEQTNAVYVVEVVPPPTPPVITGFTMLTRGSSVTFMVEATGRPEPFYQWTWQGQDIPGATGNVLSYTNADFMANAGYYAVRVWNEFGEVYTPPPGLLFTKPTPGGIYQGLFYDTNNPTMESSGSFQYTLSPAKRSYSGKVLIGRSSFKFSGTFSEAHDSEVQTLTGPSGGPLTLTLQLLTTHGLARVEGTIGNENWTVPLRGGRAPYSSGNPAPQSGQYTVALLHTVTNTPGVAPDGSSIGTITVGSSGGVKIAGWLADGTSFSQSARLTELGEWPLYVSLYKERGLLVGWLRFTNNETGSIQADSLYWLKEAFGDRYYPDGFVQQLKPTGSSFSTSPDLGPWPPNGAVANIIPFSTGVAAFSAGDMFTYDIAVWDFVDISVPAKNVLAPDKGPENLRLSVSKRTGFVSGKFINFMTGLPAPIRGVILQEQGGGLGYFLSSNLSGYFSLSSTDGSP